MPDNLANLLMDHPFVDDRDLLCTIDGTVSAGRAREMARATATRLLASGLEPGHGVAVRLPTGPELVTTMVGIWLAGGVFVPINDRSPEAEVAHVVETIRPLMIIDDGGERGLPDPARHDDAVAFVTWTSGTTGPPKAILQSHGGYLELLDRVLAPLRGQGPPRRVPDREPTPNLVPVSVALNAGIYNVCFGLRAGAAVVLMPRFSTADFSALVHRYQVRSTVLPPAAMVMLTEDAAVTDLRPLRFVRSITAPLSPLAARRFMERFGVTVLNSYGQAEVGEVVGWTAADAREHPEKLGAAGRPLPGVDIKVVDEDGRAVRPRCGRRARRASAPHGGRVRGWGVARGPGGCRRASSAPAITPRIDPDGFVWIEGRTSDLINRGGTRCSPSKWRRCCASIPG